MPKKTSSKTETEQVIAATPVVVDAAAAVEKKARKPKAPKAEAAPAPVVDTPAPAVDAAVDAADAEAPLAEQSVEFLAKLQQLGTLISSLKTEYRTLEKKWSREVKAAQKQSSKRKRKAGNRAPSGFVKPTLISNELAAFLGKPEGSVLARTEVTREVNAYIRNQKLQDKDNGRKINPDAKLLKLLKLKKGEELTYFNLQKFMAAHFAKTTPVASAAPAVAAGGAVKA
jgi:chromatin remodeling complex protein RSC6